MILKPSRQDKYRFIGLIFFTILTSCGRMVGIDKDDGSGSRSGLYSEPVSWTAQKPMLDWLKYHPEKISPRAVSSLKPELQLDQERSKLAIGYGIEKPQPMDLGVYGKIGPSTVFVASRKQIPDYDRLYWVMIRVLSEKYGCFIRRKFPYENQIGFECRDRRTVVMQRAMSRDHVKFVGWQFDPKGKEVILPKASRKSKALALRP